MSAKQNTKKNSALADFDGTTITVDCKAVVCSGVFGSIHKPGDVVTVERIWNTDEAGDGAQWCVYVRGAAGPGWIPATALTVQS